LTYVQGLKHAGAIDLFAYLFAKASTLPSLFAVLVQNLIVAFGASVMNNWPMTILGLTSIKHATVYYGLDSGAFTGSVFANIIGNNLGPHFFPLGALAILMWLGTMKRKGLTIGWNFRQYRPTPIPPPFFLILKTRTRETQKCTQ